MQLYTFRLWYLYLVLHNRDIMQNKSCLHIQNFLSYIICTDRKKSIVTFQYSIFNDGFDPCIIFFFLSTLFCALFYPLAKPFLFSSYFLLSQSLFCILFIKKTFLKQIYPVYSIDILDVSTQFAICVLFYFNQYKLIEKNIINISNIKAFLFDAS